MLRKVSGPKPFEVGNTGENCIMTSFIIYTAKKCYLGGQIKEVEMGRACGMSGRGNKCM